MTNQTTTATMQKLLYWSSPAVAKCISMEARKEHLLRTNPILKMCHQASIEATIRAKTNSPGTDHAISYLMVFSALSHTSGNKNPHSDLSNERLSLSLVHIPCLSCYWVYINTDIIYYVGISPLSQTWTFHMLGWNRLATRKRRLRTAIKRETLDNLFHYMTWVHFSSKHWLKTSKKNIQRWNAKMP